jgi:hypothetical protein
VALSRSEIRLSSLIAVEVTKNLTIAELALLAEQLRSPDHCALCVNVITDILKTLPMEGLSDHSPEFLRDLVERISSIAMARSRAH